MTDSRTDIEAGKPADPLRRGPASQTDFTRGKVSTHIVKLTGNTLMGMISVMTASLMETVYIGRLGTEELAAVSFTFPLVMILQGIGMGLGLGASSVVARVQGEGDRDRVGHLFTHSFVLVISITVLIAVIAHSRVGGLFQLLGAQPEILPHTIAYMKIWLLGLPFFIYAYVGSTLMRAAGDAVRPGLLMTVGSALHMVIAPFFVFGWGPAPDLGIEGAALSFVIARTVSFCLYTYYIFLKDRLALAGMSGFLTSCREILHIGLPAIAANLIGPMSIAVITRLLAGHGPGVVAGYGSASRVESMVMMILASMAMCIGPIVGQNWGAGRLDRVKAAVLLACRFALIWGLLAFVMLFAFGESLVRFINEDPSVVEPAAYHLAILPLSFGPLGVVMLCSNCFNAFGKPYPPLIISLCQMLIIQVPLALLADRIWGYVGIFAATTLTNCLLSVVAWVWINREINRRALQAGLPRALA